jgi:hypothetical protein
MSQFLGVLNHGYRRALCRPRVRWIDKTKETLHEHKMTIIETARKAKTRRLYLPRHPNGLRGNKDYKIGNHGYL